MPLEYGFRTLELELWMVMIAARSRGAAVLAGISFR
jgi:hypothetical protein